MSVEAIINQINDDTENEVKKIKKDTKKKIDDIINQIKKETDEKVHFIIEKGKQDINAYEKIEIAKANQDGKREQMNAKEHIIEICFQKAIDRLKNLDENRYENIIHYLINRGKACMNRPFSIQTTRPVDKKIAKQHNIKVDETIEAIGGVRLVSEDHTLIIDYTFEEILERNRQDIRIHVGSILFS